jgi:hypothetical protein
MDWSELPLGRARSQAVSSTGNEPLGSKKWRETERP